ncbi:MAG: InlB B-repeat-containing protein [Bacteroidaceae bacterium]|nr:InlB B-repeat-containing protein [Bacteroidaceae bacterium]
MKRILIALAIILVGQAQAQHIWDGTADKQLSGNGSQANPFLISTPEQLAGLAEMVNVDRQDFAGKHFRLTQDIYLNSFAEGRDTLMWTPIGQIFMDWQTTDTCAFRGSFDGGGHTIHNIYYAGGIGWGSDWDPYAWNSDITSLDLSIFYKALFGVVDGGTIENVNMSGGMMSALSQAMLVTSVQNGSTIRNCHVEGTLRSSSEGTEMAGLAYDNHGLIENCSVNVTTWGYRAAPIAVNNHADGVIRNCVAEGEVNITCHAVGSGFVCNNYGLIEQCESSTNISAKLGNNPGRENSLSAAGFVEKNSGIIRECMAHGKLSSDNTPIFATGISVVAGFCMTNTGRIESCYADGEYKDNSTGDYPAVMVMFVRDNGIVAGHTYETPQTGVIVNSFAAGSISPCLQPLKTQWERFAFTFHASFNDDTNSINYELAEPSMEVNCYWRSDGLPSTNNPIGGEEGWSAHEVTLAYMQSQAFVDTLNRVAKLLGTSQWEYRPGQLPRATGVRTKDASVFFPGAGTKEDPYLVGNKEQLQDLAWLTNHGYDFRGEYLRQTADIILNAPMEQWGENMPTQFEPIGTTLELPRCKSKWSYYFRGNYDGGFHEVQNMYIDNLGTQQGLFGNISNRYNSVIRDLGVTDAYVHACSGGILAGYIGKGAHIIQCHVSGEALHVGDKEGDIGSFASDKGQYVLMLNCMSSAEVNGEGAFVGYGLTSYGSQIVNALYTGTSNVNSPGMAFEKEENCFMVCEDYDEGGEGGYYSWRTVEWLQSAECVNTLNDAVCRWNAEHMGDPDLQLNYWQMRSGDYPWVADNGAYTPAVAVKFESNGGTALPTRYMEAGSMAVVPARPTKEGQIFAGWYKDEQLTQFFDFEMEQPTSDLTLYARWIKNDIHDIDLTPFNNKFANTFHIKTAAQLRGFAAMVNGAYDDEGNLTTVPNDFEGKSVVLDNDIFLNDTTDWAFWGHNAYATTWIPIKGFKGAFNGQGHIIYGMYISVFDIPLPYSEETDSYGLFSSIDASGCTVTGLGIRASAIVMQSGDATNDDFKIGDIAGLMVGYLEGENNAVEKCFAEGRIVCPNSKYWDVYAAGIVGQERGKDNRISNCYSLVTIENVENNTHAGSLANIMYGVMYGSKNCVVSNCYSADQSYKGLDAGSNGSSTYYNKELVANQKAKGGKTTAEMKAKATYVDWDFDETWGRNNDINDGYPFLRLFYPDAPADSDDPIVDKCIDLEETMPVSLRVEGSRVVLAGSGRGAAWQVDVFTQAGLRLHSCVWPAAQERLELGIPPHTAVIVKAKDLQTGRTLSQTLTSGR